MSSETLLIQAASGLERTMAGDRYSNLQESLVAQVSAAIYYKTHVLAKLKTSKAFNSKFTKVLFDQIDKDFGEYIDAKARMNPKTLHHVYEWKKVGTPSARLFKIKVVSSQGTAFSIGSEFKMSKSMVPTKKGKHRHVFANKAFIMEQGQPVVIKPKSAERLVFDVSGYTVYMPKGESVTVRRPGGTAAKQSFESAKRHFFTSDLVSQSIKRSGFQKLFSSAMSSALKTPANVRRVQYSFSANTLRSQAENALESAFGMATV